MITDKNIRAVHFLFHDFFAFKASSDLSTYRMTKNVLLKHRPNVR